MDARLRRGVPIVGSVEGIRLVVLDFDGTLTDVFKETAPYVPAFKDDFKEALGISQQEFDQRWSRMERIVRENPFNYGWKEHGRIVVPA